MRTTQLARTRRVGKEIGERFLALVGLGLASPIFVLIAVAIKLEGVSNRNARGPAFFREQRISRGRVIGLIKFRTLTAEALASLGDGPTHIAVAEKAGQVTRVGRLVRQWYLDELPQLWNIVVGDMFLIGTRPYPLELYEKEVAKGVTRKRDMPAGLIGPVQAQKGATDTNLSGIKADAAYWELFQHASAWRLLRVDLDIVRRSIKVQLEHKGI